MTDQAKQIIVLVMGSAMLILQTGCANLAYPVGIMIVKQMCREQQKQDSILRNAQYHLKRGEHLDILAKHGIYPQKEPPRAQVKKVVIVKRNILQGDSPKNNVAQVSMADRPTIHETSIALQDTNRKLHSIFDKALETRQNLLSANYGVREEQLMKDSNGGNKNVNK